MGQNVCSYTRFTNEKMNDYEWYIYDECFWLSIEWLFIYCLKCLINAPIIYRKQCLFPFIIKWFFSIDLFICRTIDWFKQTKRARGRDADCRHYRAMAVCDCPIGVPTGPTLATLCGGSQFMLFMGLLEVFIRSQCDLEDPCGRPKVLLKLTFTFTLYIWRLLFCFVYCNMSLLKIFEWYK